MAEKIYLITGKELATHTKAKQEEIVSLFERVVQAYPEATLDQVVASVREWVASENENEINWDYKAGKATTLETPVEEKVQEETVFEEEPTQNVTEEYENFDLEVALEDEETELDYADVNFLNGEELETYDVYTNENGEEEETEEPVYEEPVYEENVEETVYEEPVLEEETAEETTEESPVYETAETEDEDAEEDDEPTDSYNEEQLFANQNPTVISRQRRYRGLLAEAAKLDRN